MFSEELRRKFMISFVLKEFSVFLVSQHRKQRNVKVENLKDLDNIQSEKLETIFIGRQTKLFLEK